MNPARSLLNFGFLVLLVGAAGGSLRQAAAWQRDRHTATAVKAALAREQAELLRLRQQAQRDAALKRVRPMATRPAGDGDSVAPEVSRAALEFVQQVHSVKGWFAANPAQHIPEMACLTESDWITLIGQADTSTDNGIRELAAAIRLKAEQNFAQRDVKPAFERYRAAHGDELPASVDDLVPLLPKDAVSGALSRYEILVTGNAATMAAVNRALGLRPDSVVDPVRDAAVWIGSYGASIANVKSNDTLLQLARGAAEAAYANAHGGVLEWDLAKITPYFRNPADAAAEAEADRKRQAEIAARQSQ